VVAGIGADDDAVTSWECTGCKALVSLLQDLFLKNATEDEIVKIITAFCIDLKIEDELVCRGIVTEFKDEVLSVFDEIALGPNELCGIVIGPSCGSPYDPYNQTWTVKLPSTPKPPVKPVPPPKAGSPTTRILFISDIHFDKNYTPGLNAECGEPLCCRPPNGAPPPGKRAAGFWGDYNCDSTIHLLDNLFSHLKNISSQVMLHMDHLSDTDTPLYKDHLSTVATVGWSVDHLSDTDTPLYKDHLSIETTII
jgi:sphingomyelin phosphodiesterase